MTAPEIPTHYLAFCDYCRSAKTFTTEHGRQQWLAHHPHEWEDADDDS